jgi:Xaa-Pro dipeptidase
LQPHLAEHIAGLQDHWDAALDEFSYDGAWLSAGDASLDFQDDQGPRFKANPYLSQWVNPAFISPGSRLLIRSGKRPVLFLHAPTDYWHAAPPLPDELQGHVDVRTFGETHDLLQACQAEIDSTARLAHIGAESASNESFGEVNPIGLVNYLHFHRARKNTYELAAMRQASSVGAAGHLSAETAFRAGGTEFDVHMAFLGASQQVETELPYGNIVAFNEHAAVLHYQFQDRVHHGSANSLLIDAGGTRTYAGSGDAHAEFAELLSRMEIHQSQLIETVRPGLTFADLHVRMHRQLGDLLADANLVHCSGSAAFESGLTETFCPHGLGHLLGLQVHDVGGHLADERGGEAPPPANYPTLRFTRAIEVDQVFTIEPGLYFIPSLLNELRASKAPVNWAVVDSLTGYGGIRIEDNVRVLADGVENLTRDAFADLLDV